jgi:hypothetical protein
MAKKVIEAIAETSLSAVYDSFSSGEHLDEFLVKLEAIRSNLTAEGWKDLKITLSVDHGYYDDDSDLEMVIRGLRLETDKEEAARLKEEEREKLRKQALAVKKANDIKRKEAEELAEYARLKAKFDK